MSGLHRIPRTWHWTTLQDIAEVVTGNTPPTSNAENYGGEIPFIKPPQLNDIPVGEAPETLSEKGLEKARLLPPKSVLVSCIGILGKTAITKNFSATNQQINAVIFEPNILPEYGFYYSQTLTPWLKENSSATTVAIINKGKFEVAPFPLPPAAEQTRIVAKLEELLSDLDIGVAELKAAQKKLVQYRQSLLKAAVEGKLTRHWREQRGTPSPQPLSHQGRGALGVDGVNDAAANYRPHLSGQNATLWEQPPEFSNPPPSATLPSPLVGEGPGERGREALETGAQLLARILKQRRANWETKQLAKFQQQGKTPPKGWQDKYPEPVKPDTSDLPLLPEGWVWASLDMLGEIASGVAKGTKRNPEIPVREVPYLRVANVQRGFLDLSEIKTILATESDIAELTLQPGDILFNEGGDRDKLGRGWIWRGEVANCIHQNHVFRMRPFLSEIVPELISHHGNTFGKTWFQNAGKQTTNLASINMTMLRLFPVPLGPAFEQQEILSLLQLQLDNLDQQEKSIVLGLKQSAAQRQNILRAAFSGQLVPQNPSDEPASVLLERIRAERAARQAAKALKKRSTKTAS